MTSGLLKLIALILMTIDHIGEFIPNSPIWFKYLGRLSAPIFFFAAAEGIYHSRDRKKYLLRMYIASVLMAAAESICWHLSGTFINNNIFASILFGTTLVYILEEYRENKPKRNTLLLLFIGWQIVSSVFCIWFNNTDPIDYSIARIIYTALGNYLFAAEGALYLTLAIVIFYLCRDNKKRLVVVFTVYCAVFFALTVLKVPTYAFEVICRLGVNRGVAEILIQLPAEILGFEVSSNVFGASFYELAFERYYQWMMIFALPIIVAYNGKRGKYPKWLFYTYYPLHLFALAALSAIL